jgi:hypothetical protein
VKTGKNQANIKIWAKTGQKSSNRIPNRIDAFQILPSKTRGDCLKIVTKPYTKDVRCNSFFARISTIYSQLPSLVRNNAPQDFEKLLNSIDLSPFLIVHVDTFNDIL